MIESLARQESLNPATARTRARYDRIARVYDQMEAGAERRFGPWRERLWQRVGAGRVLEIGVGTGKNFPYYPPGASVTGVDLSPRMLEHATRRRDRDQVDVALLLADAQDLPFPDASFDSVVTTFVFCSVPDPLIGLDEVRRVLRPGGHLLMLEHVLSGRPVLGGMMRALNPLVVRTMGANINRQTGENVARAAFTIRSLDYLWGDVVVLIDAERA